MLLTLSTTHTPATDLGHLLHKNPERPQAVELSFGQALVFYPEAGEARCTCALAVVVDPVSLVRDQRPGGDFPLGQYVNDRPYAASSFLCVALGRVFGTAMSGRSKERQALADVALPFEAVVSAVPCRGGEAMVRRLFEPLGYEVVTEGGLLDERFPEWGPSPYLKLTVRATVRLQDLLAHLYVLLPVLDADKHYWVGGDEVDKLLRRGEGWLAEHPEREVITHRYLKRRHRLAREALARLATADGTAEDPDEAQATRDAEEAEVEAPLRLNDRRMKAVVEVLKARGVSTVVDLGCGEGRFIAEALSVSSLARITGVDVSAQCLEIGARRLKLDRMPEQQRKRVELLHGSLVYRDERLKGFDAAVCIEVIEHMEPGRLRDFENNVLGFLRPPLLVVTTPNAEFNVLFPNFKPGRMRHRDHRFEWSRAELAAWGDATAARHGYTVTYAPVGLPDPDALHLGAPTQMAVFERQGTP